MEAKRSADAVRGFFAAFGRGDVEGVVETFTPDAEIMAVHDGARPEGALYGAYRGHAGAREFVAVLGKLFEPQAFALDGVVADGEVAFASGRFTHRLRATGRLFTSEWALRCVVEGGRIRQYRFYEDSAAFEAAAR